MQEPLRKGAPRQMELHYAGCEMLIQFFMPLCCQHLLLPSEGFLLQKEPLHNVAPQVGEWLTDGMSIFQCFFPLLILAVEPVNTLGISARNCLEMGSLTLIPLCTSHRFLPTAGCLVQKLPSFK